MADRDFRHRGGKSDKPDRSKKAKADWRGKGKSGAGSRSKRARTAAWTERTGGEYKHAKLRYRLKVGAWLAILIALVGGFVALLLLLPVGTPFLALTVTQYGDEMAAVAGPNAWAGEDLARFHELGDATRVLKCTSVQYAPEEARLDGLKNLRGKLLATKRGGPKKNLVIVYLSMHGAVDGDGTPCLLPPDASPYDTTTWLPMEEVIRYLFPKDKLDQLPDKKLLILDCNRIDVNWRLGLLHNSFADRLKDAFERADVPGLMILNSTGPGEVGWTSSGGIQGSVFAHYLCLGLCGEADADADGRYWGFFDRVSLSELHTYVKAGVDQWVRGNRDDRQRPMLLTSEQDDAELELVFKLNKKKQQEQQRKRQLTVQTSDITKTSRGEKIARFWTEYHTPNRNIAHRLQPLLWERFQHKLMRLERLLLAGSSYESEFDLVCKQVEELIEELGNSPLPGPLPACSLPLVRLLDRPRTDQAATQRRAYLEAADAAWEGILAKPDGVGWTDGLQAAHDARGQEIGVVELHFARMLNRHLDLPTWQENPELVRLALSTRQQAEGVAAPPDDTNDVLLSQRAHYWNARLIDEADQERRLAEDRLFIGGPSQLETVEGLYADLIGADGKGGKYGEAAELGEKVRAAYELRDRAQATTPYLAQWLFARLTDPKPTELHDLAELIQATGELEDRLETSLAAGAWRAELNPIVSLVAGKLDALQDSFDRECSALEDAGLHDPETLKGISVVLGTPLLTGASRMLLLEKLLRADSERVQGDDSQVGAGAPGEDSAPDDEGTEQNHEPIRLYAKRLEAFSKHPAVTLLGRLVTDDTAPAVEVTEELNARAVFYQPGEVVRESLASLNDRLGKLPRELELVLRASGDAPRSRSEIRAGLAEADRLVRAAAPLVVQRKADYRTGEVAEPAVLLRRLDLHYLLLWHCHRTLEDFWGPADKQRDATSFFQLAAQAYLTSARELGGSTAPATVGKIDLEALLEARSKAALRPKAGNLQVDDDESARPAELKLSVAVGPDLPPGEAAMFLSDSTGEETIPVLSADDLENPDLRRIGVEIDPASGSEETAVPRHWVANSSLPNDAERLNTIALYRGHRVPYPVVLERLGAGIPIEYLPPDYADPTVTVVGEAMSKSSVMFILDCSGSMSKKMVTADDTRVTQTSRFIEAKKALGVVLAELAGGEDNPYQVGALAYGHRVGWSPTNEEVVWDPEVPPSRSRQGKLIGKNQVEGDLPHPSMDIEQIWPLARFTEFERQSLETKLHELRPLGETPLYESIRQAVDMLRRGNSPVNHIVAITDGVNEQSDANQEVLPSRVKEEINSLGAGKVRLDIVAINTNDKDIEQHLNSLMPDHTPADRAEELRKRIAKRDDLINLANSTGGDFYPADDPDQLLAALEESLQLSRYEVVKLPDERVIDTKSLGKKSQIEQAFDAKVDYLVRVPDRQQTAQSEITLLGGEGLKLYLNRSANRLEHRRYFDQPQAAGRDSVEEVINPLQGDNAGPASLFIGAHLPAREGDSVRFGVSVQNQTETVFTPRPVEAWVRISPLVSDEEQRGDYIFYDLVFVENRPVPMIECLAPRWPAKATKAEIRVFCKFQATDPKISNTIAVDELVAHGIYTVDSLPGLAFSLEKRRGESGADYRIVVMERHEAGSKLNSAKVAMYPPPKRTVHRFRHETAEIRHIFFYDDAAAEDNRIGGYRVIITPRSGLSENAVSPSEPLVVRIPD